MASRCAACLAAAEQRGALYRALVGLAEDSKPGQRFLRILAVTQGEGIEAAARQVEQLVPEYVADSAQLTLPAVALAQQSRGGKAASVAELRKIHGHHLEMAKVARDQTRFLVAVEPHPDATRPGEQRLALVLPQRERNDDVARRQLPGQLAVGGGLKPLPRIADDVPVFDDDRHRHAS